MPARFASVQLREAQKSKFLAWIAELAFGTRDSRCKRATVLDARLTTRPISCGGHRVPRSDAARPLPRLTIALAEAICNGRDAVAQKQNRSFSSGPANGRASAALGC